MTKKIACRGIDPKAPSIILQKSGNNDFSVNSKYISHKGIARYDPKGFITGVPGSHYVSVTFLHLLPSITFSNFLLTELIDTTTDEVYAVCPRYMDNRLVFGGISQKKSIHDIEIRIPIFQLNRDMIEAIKTYAKVIDYKFLEKSELEVIEDLKKENSIDEAYEQKIENLAMEELLDMIEEVDNEKNPKLKPRKGIWSRRSKFSSEQARELTNG